MGTLELAKVATVACVSWQLLALIFKAIAWRARVQGADDDDIAACRKVTGFAGLFSFLCVPAAAFFWALHFWGM